MRSGLPVVFATLLSCLTAASPAWAGEPGLGQADALTLIDPLGKAFGSPQHDTPPQIELEAHPAPLPSAALAGIVLLSMTAAHGFGRKRRRANA